MSEIDVKRASKGGPLHHGDEQVRLVRLSPYWFVDRGCAPVHTDAGDGLLAAGARGLAEPGARHRLGDRVPAADDRGRPLGDASTREDSEDTAEISFDVRRAVESGADRDDEYEE